jgi:hypothetical protein
MLCEHPGLHIGLSHGQAGVAAAGHRELREIPARLNCRWL